MAERYNKMGKPPGTRETKTKYRLNLLAQFIEAHNRMPDLGEVKQLLGIENDNTARNYLKMIKAAMPKPEDKLSEIQDRLLVNIKKRLGDEESPMIDSDMIKLLEFMYPKKSESHQRIEEEVKVIDDGDAEELDQYRQLLEDTEASDPKPL